MLARASHAHCTTILLHMLAHAMACTACTACNAEKFAHTKVRHLGNISPAVDPVGLQQHIAQLEVPMNDAKAVYVVHAFGYLLRRPQQCPLQSERGTGISSKVLETMLTRSVKPGAQSASCYCCQCEDAPEEECMCGQGEDWSSSQGIPSPCAWQLGHRHEPLARQGMQCNACAHEHSTASHCACASCRSTQGYQ